MAWSDALEPIPEDTLRVLAAWALGTRSSILGGEYRLDALPRSAWEGGVAGVVAYAIAQRDEPVARLWRFLHHTNANEDPVAARRIADQLTDAGDWRKAFGAAALLAFDAHPFPDSFGVFQGLETARAVLLSRATLAEISLLAGLEAPLPLERSPFSDPVVQRVLERMDRIVALQNDHRDWPAIVIDDLARFPRALREVIATAQRRFPTLHTMTAAVGSRLVTSLRALMEDALRAKQLDLLGPLDKALTLVAARHGSSRDVILAGHRAGATNALVFDDQATQLVVAHHLEHLLAGAYWLADRDAQATVHHGLGLVLRGMARKIPGVLDALLHLERATTLRRALGDTVAALGSQIDMTSVLIQFGPVLGMLEEAPEYVRDWALTAEALLQDAIDELSRRPQDAVATAYLGEAFHNLARLHQTRQAPARAQQAAQAALDLSQRVGDKDLEARASLVLGQVSADPVAAAQHYGAMARLVQEVRRGMSEDRVAVAWMGNRQSAFSQQIDFLLETARSAMSETQVCAALLEALEDARGLTYNRWLGGDLRFDAGRLQAALAEERDTVVAVYAVGRRRIGLVLLSADAAPRLHVLDLPAHALERLTHAHLAGLKQQGDVRHLPLWDALQGEFLADARRLVEPLEPAVAAGKRVCLIPHGPLHALALHTLTSRTGEPPLGLRTPVYSNPSLTNWLLCRSRSIDARAACLASAAPEPERSQFARCADVGAAIAAAGFALQVFDSRHSDLTTLKGKWGVQHIVCHGLFRAPRSEYGLMLAADGEPPPRALGAIPRQALERHLATPARLREHAIAGQLTFLSSCVSARNERMPGDDLMGITRAIFANGAACLIAGAWTVASEYAKPFADTFYAKLTDAGAASALLAARRAVAALAPDPFFWGAFVLQGADAALHLGDPA